MQTTLTVIRSTEAIRPGDERGTFGSDYKGNEVFIPCTHPHCKKQTCLDDRGDCSKED